MNIPSSSPGHSRLPRQVALGATGLIALAAVLAGAYAWWASLHAQPQYQSVEATQGDIERSVNVTGSINPRVTVQVGSYVSGTVKSLYCDFNTQVKAGQICAKIDPSTFQVAVDQSSAQLKSSRAQLHKDEAALTYAKSVFDRDTKLLSDGIVAQEIVDNDKNIYQQARSQLDLDKATIVAQEASLKSAVVNLGYTNIVSPVTGTVLTRNVDVGQTVASSLQTPTLFLIGKDMTKMQVDANVSEADVGRIAIDQDVTFSVQAYPDKTFSGTVRQIRRGPITVQNVVTYDVVVAVDNPDLLLFPGMTADAEIVTDARENVLRIPLAAIRFTPERGARSGDARDNHDDGKAADQVVDQADKHPGPPADAHAEASATGKTQASDDGAKAAAATAAASTEGQGEHRWQHRGEHRGKHRGEHAHDGSGDRTTPAAQTDDQADDHADDHADAGADTHAAARKPEAPVHKRARVWVLRDGVPHALWITIGLDDGDLVEVSGGALKAGDKVIVSEMHPAETKSPTRNPAMQSPFGQMGKRNLGRP